MQKWFEIKKSGKRVVGAGETSMTSLSKGETKKQQQQKLKENFDFQIGFCTMKLRFVCVFV